MVRFAKLIALYEFTLRKIFRSDGSGFFAFHPCLQPGNNPMKLNVLSAVVAATLYMSVPAAHAQETPQSAPTQRSNVSSTSKVTADNTKRARQLDAVQVTAVEPSLGGGLMAEQDAPKAVSTITRSAIQEGAPGGTFVQAIESIPGAFTSTDDYTGLNDGDYSIRGFTGDEVGTTVNGAPINDSGNYRVYSTEYGDAENMGDITVQQGWPDVDMPISGAAGGSIGWATIDPLHRAGLDASQSFGSNSYHRTFLRLNTGDLGPVRSWLSYSNNETNLWNGPGKSKVTKVDGKSIWTIDNDNSISFSLQYNREVKNSYLHLTKKQAAQQYEQNYSDVWMVPENLGSTSTTSCGPIATYNACNYQLHVNPFKSLMASADGEFTLSDSLHLSVVPYFQYGSGGGSGATAATETPYADDNQYLYINGDLNGDGAIANGPNGAKALVYSINQSYTYRPGVIAKLSQDFGVNDTLVYGVWWERPRQQQDEVFSPVDWYTGQPSDVWGKVDVLHYPDGTVMKAYNEYTTTTTEKAFATNTWTPSDKWTITTGLAYIWARRSGFDYEYPGADYCRYADNCQFGGNMNQTYHKWSPTAGVKYQMNDANQFYFGIGRTFRTPINGAVMQNYAAGYFSGNKVVNKPETSTTADLGWRYYNSDFSASLDAYAANFHNKQVSGFDETAYQTVYTSLPSVHMRGMNGEASVKLNDNFKIYGSYAYTIARMQSNTDTLGDGIYYTSGKTLVNAPKNTGYVALKYHQGGLWATLGAKYRGAVWGDWSNTEKVGGYTTFNLSAGYHFPDFASGFRNPYIKVNVFNLADHRAFTWASSSPFLASGTTAEYDTNGVKLYQSAATYSVLESRTFMVTFGASFF
jgi:iron complex outermembrane receptor protein